MKNNDLLTILENQNYDNNTFIKIIFESYQKRKQSGKLYSKDDHIPENIIKIFYSEINNPRFDSLIANFKREYINNENDIEDVHVKSERLGLGIAYEYIHKEIDYNKINIYEILKIHQLIYSKSPHPEFGGTFRNIPIYLPDSGVETEDWSNIPMVISKLYKPVKELINEGIQIGENHHIEKIIPYIDKCVELNCQLIKIHPFFDGNGRTIRTFTNLLFIIAKIPPIYIKKSERDEYGKVMNLALTENDLSQIKRFYYYKICDSLYELDVKPKLSKTKVK